MLPNNRTTTHPGEILLLEFLEPMEVSQSKFARHLGVPIQRVNELVKGKRGITPETAWLLSASLGTTPEFWMNLQVNYELTSLDPP
ncbi:MAG: HigA family addiction module antitoxin, partial [Granulosicoccaceae bacterium]